MASGSNILLITKENATANMVKSALNGTGHITLAGVCRDVSELRSHLSNTEVRAVVVDIDPDPVRVLYDLDMILDAYPETHAVVISSSSAKELILKAMQAGARHFLEKRTVASELPEVLQVLIHNGGKKQTGSGLVISIFSASGGCGATTVAINLASELRLSSSRPVLAIDLDACYGSISTHLGITSEYGIADVLARGELIDEHLIKSSAYDYAEDFHVLTSPASLESPRTRSLQYESLPAALEVCRQAYGHTIIDAPRIPQSTVRSLGSLSDVVLVVFQLTVKDVRFARFMVSSLTNSGVADEKTILLANRVRRRGPLVRLEDSRKAVGLTSCQAIRSDWRKAMKSLNRGLPLAHVARRSGLRRDFRKLAAKVCAYGANGNGKI
jgi:pilus assembly protein CpaE